MRPVVARSVSAISGHPPEKSMWLRWPELRWPEQCEAGVAKDTDLAKGDSPADENDSRLMSPADRFAGTARRPVSEPSRPAHSIPHVWPGLSGDGPTNPTRGHGLTVPFRCSPPIKWKCGRLKGEQRLRLLRVGFEDDELVRRLGSENRFGKWFWNDN